MHVIFHTPKIQVASKSRLQDRSGISIFVIVHYLNIVCHVSYGIAIMYLGRFDKNPGADRHGGIRVGPEI